MSKPSKTPLRNVLLAEKPTINPKDTKGKYVLEGGALIYLVHWWKGMRPKEPSVAHVSHVRKDLW